MTYLTFIAFFLAFMSSSAVFAKEPNRCLSKAYTQMEMNRCAGVGLEEADVQLNRVYKKIKTVYSEDKVFLGKLKSAQLAWITSRDADFDLQYPHKEEPRYYGSVFPMCAADHKVQLTLKRVAFLKQWLVGTEEGDVCSGSQMTQWQLTERLKTQ
ncbi:lysozyme inhibitor LprI family protein [Shewanella surugensis]|uniref:DUF1311 domain-containing protein n=1 Tax=Shewanella surugensis TaxID=212020 RepID=A0ABT0LA69_9GAMM|nr:lysozyme inhibitor LprI family protein [Shewanella surugensis]MCL1124056.1 DUF1311 domain-containing protein [Shewanella surugensis]